MKARRSKWAQKFIFNNEKNARKILKQLIENDKLDGKPIKTDFGNFKKLG